MKHIISAILIFTSLLLKAQHIIEESIPLANGKIVIPGTLSYPETKEKIPLAIFIHGSGNIDRNGNQKIGYSEITPSYIKMLADSLNNKGIAFYRYDKRTSIPENLKLIVGKIVFEDLVDDARVSIAQFKKDKRFSGITLIGHSQGSLTAMLAADDSIDNYISLAGPSEDFATVVTRQISSQNSALVPAIEGHFKELKETDTIVNVNPSLQGLFNPSNYSFLKSYMAYNPADEIKNVKARTMIIQGDTDLQVRTEDAENLKKARPDATLTIIPKMNHLLKEIQSTEENNKSYYSANFAISAALVETIAQFIKQ